MKFVAAATKVALPAETTVNGLVGIGPNGKGGFGLEVALNVSIPGMERAAAEAPKCIRH